MSGHVTMATANRTLSTDKGLSSSSGASSANHERVFGKRRFLGLADGSSRALVTERRPAAPSLTQPRQLATGWGPGQSAQRIADLTGIPVTVTR
jgi:hypothetical protein